MPGTCSSCSRLRNGPLLLAVLDQVAGHQLVQAGDVPQQRHAGRVQVDADRVDARLDDAFERLLELLGVDVVLIEADADVLRIDLDQLAERVLQAPADRDGAAQRGVEVGELLAADRAGRVDAGAGLVDDDVGQVRPAASGSGAGGGAAAAAERRRRPRRTGGGVGAAAARPAVRRPGVGVPASGAAVVAAPAAVPARPAAGGAASRSRRRRGRRLGDGRRTRRRAASAAGGVGGGGRRCGGGSAGRCGGASRSAISSETSFLRLAAGGAVADGDDVDLVLADQLLEPEPWPRPSCSAAGAGR